MAATELASIVASYLRKHGFVKTLSAFLRENGHSFQETDSVDLDTIYKLYSSTQAYGVPKVKEAKKLKSEDGPVVSDGEMVVRDDAGKAFLSLHINGGISSEKKKKKKKGEEKNASNVHPELDETGGSAAEPKKSKNKEGLTKKKGGENLEVNDTKIEGLKSQSEKSLVTHPGKEKHSKKEAYSNGIAAVDNSTLKESVIEHNVIDGGELTNEMESTHSQRPSSKKKKKQKKDEEGALLQVDEALNLHETKLAEETQVLSEDCDPQKKKRRKSKDAGRKEEAVDGVVVNSASKVSSAERIEQQDVSKQTVDTVNQPGDPLNKVEGVESRAKKKKYRKDFFSESCEEPKLEQSKKDGTDDKKFRGKRREVKEDTAVEGDSIQDANNFGSPPEKLTEVDATADTDAKMLELGSTKTKKKKETPSDKKTPTGALAFKRVEVDKVTFSDPRLTDNSYWAKDGAEEGYGAKAQEVLGLVRGRDFRHEKTKKKRGSYRGGYIGLESHSIKFENSDDDE